MPRITLVTTEVQRAREADRQVGVDLYDAVIGADIVIIAAPALAGHELAGEGFAFGHGDMRRGAPATTRDRGVEHLFRSEEHTSELQSLMRISYAVFCLKKKKTVITLS